MRTEIFNSGLACKGSRRATTRFRSLICLSSFVVFLVFLISAVVNAQTISGTISGTVVDSQNAVVPHASVSAQNEALKTIAKVATDNDGRFVFPLLLPGTYTITIEAPGFKSVKRTGVVLNANSRITIGQVQLEVGAASQTVVVQAQKQQLTTDTAALGDTIVGEQLQNIQVNGQSPLYFLGLTPGVSPTTGNAENSQQYNCCTINGGTASQLHVTTNGGTNEDTGGNSGWMAPVSLDAVQEVKILTNSYDAEYGRSGGAQINVVTKGGTSQFHGMGFEYYRDRGMNANSWSNNRVDLPRSAYHYNDFGFNVGGPIFFRSFNNNRDKLFFFVDEEWQKQLVPTGQKQATVPTDAERNGDFSQSVDQNGNPVAIINPATGKPFSGNMIPAGSLYGPGVGLLRLFPEPNAVSASHPNYNYVSQFSTSHPRREDNFRIDYDPNQRWRFYGSFLKATDNEASPYGIWGYSNIPLYTFQYSIPGYQYVLNATTVISPTSVNEVSYVQGHDAQTYSTRAGSPDWTMSGTGVTLPTLSAPYKDFLPGFSFGGTRIGNSANLSGSLYFFNANTSREVFDNYSKNLPSHFLKFGLYYFHNWKVQPSGATYDGAYNFGDDPNNPFDTGFGFANAALGVFDNFSQANAFVNGYPLYNQWEFYGQDTWRINRRLTLSYGVRFYYLQPVHNTTGANAGEFTNFIPSQWTSANAPVLLRPAIVNGTKVAVDPTTGQTYPQVYIGNFFSASALTNGMKSLGTSNITDSPGIRPAPRIGIIYDLLGNAKVMLHAGGGMFIDRTQTDTYDALVGNPPATVTSTINYGYVSSLTTGLPVFSPYSPTTWNTSSDLPVTYNFNLGTEMVLPKKIIGDISYVGAIQNHQEQSVNINPVPFGAAFLPQNQDPTATNPNALPGSNALPANFMRPLVGFSKINENKNVGNTNYNSLQISLKRRISTGLFFGAAYTWSKCLGTNAILPLNTFDSHRQNYTNCSSSLSQDLTVNYVYMVPSLVHWISGGFDNRVTQLALNNWQLSGITTFTTGTPYGVTMNIPGVSAQNFTGTPDVSPQLLCSNGNGAVHTSSPYGRINPAAYTIPAIPSFGIGCKKNNIFGPGIDDWDMSLRKTIPLGERAKFEFGGQAFNVFNHTQFSGVNSTINYSGLTNPTVTNEGSPANISGFGAVSGSRSPRVLQLVGKVRF